MYAIVSVELCIYIILNVSNSVQTKSEVWEILIFEKYLWNLPNPNL